MKKVEWLKKFKAYEKVEIFIGRFKTVNKTLAKLLGISVAWVFLYDFILVKIPEWITGASTLGLIARNICFAFITGFIFYFINTHLANHKAKVKTYRYVANKIASLNVLSSNLIHTVKATANVSNANKNEETLEEVVEWCKQIQASSFVGFRVFAYRIGFGSWYELFNYLDSETSKIVRDLLLVRDMLDSESLRLITNIENQVNMFMNISKGQPIGTDTNSLESSGLHIYEYRRMCKELQLHLRKEYKIHENEYHYLERKETRERREKQASQQAQQQNIQS